MIMWAFCIRAAFTPSDIVLENALALRGEDARTRRARLCSAAHVLTAAGRSVTLLFELSVLPTFVPMQLASCIKGRPGAGALSVVVCNHRA